MDKNPEMSVSIIITLIGMLGGFCVFLFKNGGNWQRMGDRMDAQDNELKSINKKLENIETLGSPSSRTAIMVLNGRVESQDKQMNSRLDSHNQRLMKVEDALVIIAAMQTNLEWMAEYVKSQMAHTVKKQ